MEAKSARNPRTSKAIQSWSRTRTASSHSSRTSRRSAGSCSCEGVCAARVSGMRDAVRGLCVLVRARLPGSEASWLRTRCRFRAGRPRVCVPHVRSVTHLLRSVHSSTMRASHPLLLRLEKVGQPARQVATRQAEVDPHQFRLRSERAAPASARVRVQLVPRAWFPAQPPSGNARSR